MTAQANGFILQTTLPRLSWASTEAIAISTTFTWAGAEPTKMVWTSGGGPVMFALEEIGGSRVVGPVSDDICARKEYSRGVAAVIPFAKSGGWSDDDPNAPFYRQFFADPELHLPAAQWRLRVLTEGYLADCALDAPTLGLELPAILLEIR